MKFIPREEYDFSGYVTKNNVQCQDGRVIKHNAFKHHHGQKVPLVYQHDHNNPSNVLGHIYLENRDDGVYGYGVFNGTQVAQDAKELVKHGDLRSMSIYANQLRQNGTDVIHGNIREVSLVLAGANPEAYIDDIAMHSENGDLVAEIYHGVELDTEENKMEIEKFFAHAEKNEQTMEEIVEGFTPEQRDAVEIMLAEAHEIGVNSVTGKDEDKKDKKDTEEKDQAAGEDAAAEHSAIGGDESMKHNVFEQNGTTVGAALSHDAINGFLGVAQQYGTMQNAIQHAGKDYGITNIEFLFPEARTIEGQPDFVSRDMAYVADVLASTSKTPFSKVKTIHADITMEEARAKGYITGNEKKEEVFELLKRETHPQTIYKKQKLDRDDIVDASGMDVVAWMKGEMNVMLKEELARAILVGDGREFNDADKINETKIRPVATDVDFYAHKVYFENTTKAIDIPELFLRAKKFYKGSGGAKLYAPNDFIVDQLLTKDQMGRRYYNNISELAQALGVVEIVEVEVMENTDTTKPRVRAIMVNLKDYNIGTNKGGELTNFENFDIDFNQHKYLLETRLSGALVKPKSALVFTDHPEGQKPAADDGTPEGKPVVEDDDIQG